ELIIHRQRLPPRRGSWSSPPASLPLKHFLYDATRANCRAIEQASPPVRPGSALVSLGLRLERAA
ncbi:MAG: hypothetical protein ACPIOQ_36270, partial [Promethearchaeia archaeon]